MFYDSLSSHRQIPSQSQHGASDQSIQPLPGPWVFKPWLKPTTAKPQSAEPTHAAEHRTSAKPPLTGLCILVGHAAQQHHGIQIDMRVEKGKAKAQQQGSSQRRCLGIAGEQGLGAKYTPGSKKSINR